MRSPVCRMLLQRERIHGRWQYIFIESIITDENILEQNYRYKMMYSPDYRNQSPEKVQCFSPCSHVDFDRPTRLTSYQYCSLLP